MRRGTLLLSLAACAASACNGGQTTPDGGDDGPDAIEPDANDVMYPACREIDAPAITIDEVPVSMHGDLAGAGADLASPVACASIDAPFGIASAGADLVYQVAGLAPGGEYVVRVAGGDDLAFYVVTGCSTQDGPAASECLLFVDGSTTDPEVGRFTAPGDDTPVYVVVDYWAGGEPVVTEFTLEVYPQECDSEIDCGGQTPLCQDGRCVGCVDDFDCPDAGEPLCDTQTGGCVAGYDLCSEDGVNEPANDGPAGAATLPPDAILGGAICNSPTWEADWFVFTVEDPGEHWTLQLGWTGGVDLDLEVYDRDGNAVGLSFYEQPEGIALTYLPAGEYYVKVDSYATSSPSLAVEYLLASSRVLGGHCNSDSDCGDEHRNQIFRGNCAGGACRAIVGDGLLGAGDACDSDSDCTPDTHCGSFYFIADAAERMRCGSLCDDDGDCAGLGDFVCTTSFNENFCVPACTSDDQCPASPYEYPLQPPWYRYYCEEATGHCRRPQQ